MNSLSESPRSGADDDRPIAVFDLDGTLLRGDSFLPFLISFARRARRHHRLLPVPVWIAAYLCRLMTDHAAKQRLLVHLLGGQTLKALEEHAEWFCREWLPRRHHTVGLPLLREHQEAGHRVILLSASPDVYVPAIGRALGIEEVICTRISWADKVCTGMIDGRNCKGEAKLAALKQYLNVEAAPDESYAYGDSAHDLPVLRWVRHGRLIHRGQAVAVEQIEQITREPAAPECPATAGA